MYLSEVEGELCLLHLLCTKSYMRINSWILVDIANKHWGKRYQINLDDLVKYYPPEGFIIDILGIYNEELLLQWRSKGLFSHNLQQGTTRKFKIKGKYGKCDMIWHFLCVRSVIVYNPSLVSLKLCSKVLKGKASGKG